MAGLLFGPRRALLGGLDKIFKFNPALTTFTPGMDKRAAPGPFETAPIVQGKLNGTGIPDKVTIDIGSVIQDDFIEQFDTYQGSFSFWITPEWDGNDGLRHEIYLNDNAGIYKHDNGNLSWFFWDGGSYGGGWVDVSGWTAGTTYFVVLRWDTKNSLDGTNYGCISINNVHLFTKSSIIPTRATTFINFGGQLASSAADAIIEGFTIYRRPLFDGTNGIAANWDDSGPIDEIEAIWAAGAGADPCLITGSWDVVFCLPTNSTAEALVTGTGEAWSHPHSSGVLEHQWLEDGGYLGRPWALHTSSTGFTDAGSGATLDDLAVAGDFTVEMWIAPDNWTAQSFARHIISKGDGADVGWAATLRVEGAIQVIVRCAGWEALANSADFPDIDFSETGTWHHVAIYFNGNLAPSIAVDGKWARSYTTRYVGNGAPLADAAQDLLIGSDDTWYSHNPGLYGWVAIWSDDHLSVGTDFVPSRVAPTPGGTLVECWHFDDGTGATVVAQVTSPGNDGAITASTWEEQWDQETSPIVPVFIEDHNSWNSINGGSGATIDDLPASLITVEGWIRIPKETSGSLWVYNKGTFSNGWRVEVNHTGVNAGKLTVLIHCATQDAFSISGAEITDDKWHHILFTYADGGDRIAHIYIDGIYDTGWSQAGIGIFQVDAASDLQLGNKDDDGPEGNFGWFRVSDNLRQTADFTPDSRLNPPGIDANTMLQWDMDEGAGTAINDSSGNANHGTAASSFEWFNTPDMEIDSPADRVFNWGYVIGNDAVDEGIVETLSGLVAGENYVVRAIASIESASRGRPKIIIYDETNSAQITALEGPSCFGQHDGGGAAANLTDTTARWPQMLVDWTVYNITDGSSATITAISGDGQTITAALSGGTDDLWDISDEYRLVPPGGPSEYDDYPWIETFTFELPTIARNGVVADCVSISVKMVNGVNNGVIKWHQIELLENEFDNPSLETGVGNPWIPDGWTINGLDPGESVQEVSIVHSGGSSMEYAASASNEGIFQNVSPGAGKFVSCGLWSYGDNSSSIFFGSGWIDQAHYQSNPTSYVVIPNNDSIWKKNEEVFRVIGGTNWLHTANSGASALRYADDAYLFVLDDISLTVTPASAINSAESGGLRVDGRDTCTQPIPAGILTDIAGWIKFKWIPRHNAADLHDFGSGDARFHFVFDGTHFIYFHTPANNLIQLRFNDGGGLVSNNWDCTGLIVAGTEYGIEIKYNADEMILIVDGVIRATVISPIDFGGSTPNMAYWGHASGGNQQFDSVIKAP